MSHDAGGFDHHMIVWDFNTTEQICNVELVAIPRALVLDNKQNFVIALGNAKNLSYCTYDKGTIQLLAELEVKAFPTISYVSII